jgi:hypothetical protein
MDSYFNKKSWTGFTGLSGFFLNHFPEENGQTQRARGLSASEGYASRLWRSESGQNSIIFPKPALPHIVLIKMFSPPQAD